MENSDKKKPKELSMIHKQYSVLSNKKSETQTKELDWEIEFDKKFHTTWIKSHDSMIGLNPVYAGVKCYLVDSFKVKSFISSLLLKQKQQILNLECLKEEKVTIVGHKYGTDTGEIEKMIGEGEEEWKVPRNQLRNEIKSEIEKL